MKLLIDTHVALWWLAGAPVGLRKPNGSSRTQPTACCSVPPLLGRSRSSARWASSMRRPTSSRCSPPPGRCWTPITLEHAATVECLPHHHRDPFLDGLLVAQASVEDAAIVSADPDLRAYDVRVVW